MMQTYRCAACAGVPYFENFRCGCGQQIALHQTRDALVPLDARCCNREAGNHVNRPLEIPDLHPFGLSDTVREMLSFTHHWLRQPLRAAQGEPA